MYCLIWGQEKNNYSSENGKSEPDIKVIFSINDSFCTITKFVEIKKIKFHKPKTTIFRQEDMQISPFEI